MSKNLKFKRVNRYEDPAQWVRKIDEDAYFTSIKTDKTTLTELEEFVSKALIKKYKQFWRVAREKKLTTVKNDEGESILWVGKHWKTLNTWIVSHFGVTQHGSREIMTESLANILLYIDKNLHRENVRQMFLDGKAYHAIGQEKTEENKLRPEELSNWVCFNDTEQMRETYLKMFEVSPTLTNNMRSLMLSFLSLVPPLRLNYHDMIVYRKKTPPPEGLFNYIWEYEQGKWKYVIGNDKITYKERLKPNYKRTILTLSDEIEGITDGARLNNILTQSFAVHPRTYLLTPTRILDSDKPMTEQTYKCALATIFKPKKPTMHDLREIKEDHQRR
jgi:hypothetical protein